MNDMIASGEELFAQYEELLLRKNDLKKECFHLQREYVRVFGEAIMAVFRLKLECVKRIKTIEFCQKDLNRGKEPDTEALQSFVIQETQELRDHLQGMKQEYESSQNIGQITEAEAAQIRKLYRRIVKRLHPDTHPEIGTDEQLMDIWNQVTVAYECNDLSTLEELEVMASAALARAGSKAYNTEIPNIEERMEKIKIEIREIMDKDPYQYKFLLNDPEKVQIKKDALEAERKNYEEYCAALDSRLAGILPEGVMIVWDK